MTAYHPDEGAAASGADVIDALNLTEPPELAGTMLHLPPGQWWSPDGWLHMQIEFVGAHEGRELPPGWVWVEGHLYVGDEPVNWCTVPVREEALATPDGRRRSVLKRDAAAAWLVAYLRGVGGQAFIRDVKKAAEAAGINYRTLKRARGDVPVTRIPGTYLWRLNEEPE